MARLFHNEQAVLQGRVRNGQTLRREFEDDLRTPAWVESDAGPYTRLNFCLSQHRKTPMSPRDGTDASAV